MQKMCNTQKGAPEWGSQNIKGEPLPEISPFQQSELYKTHVS